MNRRIVIAAAALALSLGALPLLAQGPGRGGRGGPGPMGVFPGLNEVGLSDQQREQVRGILEQERQAGAPGQGVRQAEQALHAAVLADAPDPHAIQAAKGALATAQSAELDHRVDLMQKIAAVLTPAQRQQLAQLQPPGGRGRGPAGGIGR